MSNHLSDLGRRDEALTAINEAVTIRRELTQALPVVFAPRLRSSLTAMADLLESMGKASEAEKARAEAGQYE